MKKLLLAILSPVLLSAALTTSASAQNSNYSKVGETEAGDPIMLNLLTIKGTRFQLFQAYGSGIMQMSFRGNCGEAVVYLEETVIANSAGTILVEEKSNEKFRNLDPNSALGISLRTVCKGIGAKGW